MHWVFIFYIYSKSNVLNMENVTIKYLICRLKIIWNNQVEKHFSMNIIYF